MTYLVSIIWTSLQKDQVTTWLINSRRSHLTILEAGPGTKVNSGLALLLEGDFPLCSHKMDNGHSTWISL